MERQSITTRLSYQNSALVTIVQGRQHHSILRITDRLLAECAASDTNVVLVTDDTSSVLAKRNGTSVSENAYTAYGYNPTLAAARGVSGFNGEYFEPATACYMLGNGYRTYSPMLMRFHSPDGWSPFGRGGLNAYGYCGADPINHTDPSGHMLSALPKAARSATINSLNEPDIFSRIIRHLDLNSTAALSRTNKHINEMTRPALNRIKGSLGQPEQLLNAALDNTYGPSHGKAYELLVNNPDIDLTPLSGHSERRDQVIRDIEIYRKFRAAQRSRSPSTDSTSASDSEDEMARINEGIRRALNEPQR